MEKHIAQEAPQGKAEQLLQAPGPRCKAEMGGLGADPPGALARPLPTQMTRLSVLPQPECQPPEGWTWRTPFLGWVLSGNTPQPDDGL